MAGIDLDGGGIDMHTEPTEQAMAALDEAVAGFRTGWAGHRVVMAELESQLGKGPMGREFAAQYNPAAAELALHADGITERVELRAMTGRACVLTYVAADDEGRRGFEG